MRAAPALLVTLSLLLTACSAETPPPPGDAPADAAEQGAAGPQDSGEATGDGVVYGAGVGDATVVSLEDLAGDVDSYVGQKVRVSGLVTGVCAKRGCWFQMGAEEGPEEVLFKVEDGVMVFPMSAVGKWADAEGTVKKVTRTLEQTKAILANQAEEAGEPFDPASVEEPMTLVMLAGTGAVIRDERPAGAGE